MPLVTAKAAPWLRQLQESVSVLCDAKGQFEFWRCLLATAEAAV